MAFLHTSMARKLFPNWFPVTICFIVLNCVSVFTTSFLTVVLPGWLAVLGRRERGWALRGKIRSREDTVERKAQSQERQRELQWPSKDFLLLSNLLCCLGHRHSIRHPPLLEEENALLSRSWLKRSSSLRREYYASLGKPATEKSQCLKVRGLILVKPHRGLASGGSFRRGRPNKASSWSVPEQLPLKGVWSVTPWTLANIHPTIFGWLGLKS